MDAELEQSLKDNYPTVFELLNDPPDDDDELTPTISLYGCQCDDGWYRLIDSVAAELERYNDRTDEEPVVATQVKEKFGGLRFYTNHTPDGTYAVTSHTRYLSKMVCELCGEMETSRVRKNVGFRWKCLCDAHYYDARNLPEDIEIWQFEMDCFQCEASVDVVYPRPLGGPEGGSWNLVGEALEAADYSNVKRVYSDTQKMFVWGNHCPECDVYLGNYFVREAAKDQSQGWQDRDGFRLIDTV
jgi:hypothetical protein